MAERTEEPETDGPEPLAAGPDPIAAAMTAALRRRRSGGKADPEFDAFLREQTDLIQIQKEHLHEQRALILSRLRWGRFSDRMKALLQVMTALVGLAIVLAVGVMAWDASQDRSLVVEAFSAPPTFAQNGLGGQVIAADVTARMDAIHRFVERVGSFSSSQGVTADSQDGVKLEIPETGISVTELSRALRQWLGADRTIDGSLRQTSDGQVRLEAQLAGHDPVAATGPAAQLGDLERQVAEQLFGQVDPENLANYLDWSGRRAEGLAAMARLPGLARTVPDRADGYSLWSDHLHDPVAAEALARTAIAIDPKLITPWNELTKREEALGRDEAALADARRMLTTHEADQAASVRGQGFRGARLIAASAIDDLTGNFEGDARLLAHVASWVGKAKLPSEVGSHDAPAARALVAGLGVTATPRDARSMKLDADLAAEDWVAAARDAAQVLAMDDQARASAATADDRAGFAWEEQVEDRLRLAQALERARDEAGAATAIAPTPLDCYPCLRERGRVAALARDWTGADRWFSEAVRQGPSLPFAYADWGEMLLAKGDPLAAIAKLRLAHEKGPHWADALTLWGQALMRTGDLNGAAATFAQADKHAPKWGHNHLLWGEALMLSGRYAEARAQYQIASGLDLSVGDRAALNVLLARTATGPLHG